jgi:hypothetical protein
MITKIPIVPHRIRRIGGSFAFIEHRLLQKGFLQLLTHHEFLLYIFLILAADRQGLSYYAYDKICMLLRLSLDDYILARNRLIELDLIAFDGQLFQVLSLPENLPANALRPLTTQDDMHAHDPATIQQLIQGAFQHD